MMLSTSKVVTWELCVSFAFFYSLDLSFVYFDDICSPSCSMYDLGLRLAAGLLVLLASSVHLDPLAPFLGEEEVTGDLVAVGA